MAHTWTWDKLVRNAERLNPKRRGRNYPYTPKFEISSFTSGPNRGQKTIVPFVGTKTCLVSLRAWGVTQASLHVVTLSFSNVDIQTENPNNEREYFQIEYNGDMYWIHKFDRLRNPMANRCTCKDYFFTWAYYNMRSGCLYGPAPKPYQRKTTWMPPRNPAGVPGVCKHIYNAWNILRNSGLTMN